MHSRADWVGRVEARVEGQAAAATEAVGWEVVVASVVVRRAAVMVVWAVVKKAAAKAEE